jgi:hypothetical protein
MKKILLLVLVMAVLAGTAAANSNFVTEPNKENTMSDSGYTSKYSDKHDDTQKDKCFDKCYEKCFCIVKCDGCGEKHPCDSKCGKCGEKCEAHEYCPSCGAEYLCESIDGKCDKCGQECYWLKSCDKCGDHQQYNGYCDKCGAKCHYDKCCYTFCDKYCLVDTKCKENCPSCDQLPKPCNTCMKTAEEIKPMVYKPMMQDP